MIEDTKVCTNAEKRVKSKNPIANRPIPKEGHRFCCSCKEEKPLTDFTKDATKKHGRGYKCRSCSSTAPPKPTPRAGYKFCTKCGEEKILAKFSNSKATKDGKSCHCKACIKQNYLNNREDRLEKDRLRRLKTKKPEKQKPNGYVNIDPYSPLNFKICDGCNELLPVTMFTIAKVSKKGKPYFKRKCKPCQNKITAAFYQEHREDILYKKLLKRRENPHLDRERIAKRRADDPEGEAAKDREYRQNTLDKAAARSAKRKAAELQAIPKWYEEDKVKSIYFESSELTKYVLSTDVDHIVPLQSDLVCGLHCIDNLRIIPKLDNISKSNRYWEDMWDYEDYIEETAILIKGFKIEF